MRAASRNDCARCRPFAGLDQGRSDCQDVSFDHRCGKIERLFRGATAAQAVQLRRHHGLHYGRTTLGHGDQYGLRDNRRAVAVPGIGTVHRTAGTFDVAERQREMALTQVCSSRRYASAKRPRQSGGKSWLTFKPERAKTRPVGANSILPA